MASLRISWGLIADPRRGEIPLITLELILESGEEKMIDPTPELIEHLNKEARATFPYYPNREKLPVSELVARFDVKGSISGSRKQQIRYRLLNLIISSNIWSKTLGFLTHSRSPSSPNLGIVWLSPNRIIRLSPERTEETLPLLIN